MRKPLLAFSVVVFCYGLTLAQALADLTRPGLNLPNPNLDLNYFSEWGSKFDPLT